MELKRAHMIAQDLMKYFGVADWSLQFDRAKVRFGVCKFKLKAIGLSAPLVKLNDEAKMIDTILHEIAHAIAGPAAHHGRVWRLTALSIGATPDRCYRQKDIVAPVKKFIGQCPSCLRFVERHLRRAIACGACCRIKNAGKFSKDFLFVWGVKS
jgi:predicted SprT family Zn-dependent metalloprotease